MYTFKKCFKDESTGRSKFKSWATSLFYKSCCIVAAFMCIAAPFVAQTDEFNLNAGYLFKSEFVHFHDDQPDLIETYAVLQFLKERALPGVVFGESELTPYFENLGIGSAMALDFLARYLNECINLTEKNISLSVKGFEPYYKIQTPLFVAREYAFDNISFKNQNGLSSEIIKFRKMQSIANYYNLELNPVTVSLKRKDIKSGKAKFKKIIEDLPVSTYVIRALDPTTDLKECGHTMILIKNKLFSIFYESNLGAIKIDKGSGKLSIKIGEYIEDFLIELPFLEFRVYEATSGEGGCLNLSTEVF